MIPDLPEGVTSEDALKFYDKLSGNLSDQATVHVHWWTHRQNPAVCWVCDILILITKVLDISQKKYTKSPTDMLTDESSDQESISENEANYNVNDETQNEPEYDVVDEDETLETS